MCESWDLSRTYPTSLGQNWDFSPCPRLSPVPGRVVQVRALTFFAVVLGVGFDAILGVDFLYEHGISVNLEQHCLVFEAHEGLIVPLVGRHPRFKHACVLTHDVALYPGGRALVRFACERPGRRIGPPRAPEVYLIAARKDQKLGLVVLE